MLLVNIFWSIVFWEYWWDFDDFDGDNYFFILWFFIQIYFLIVTIVWLIKCLIYKKKWASQKSLNPAKESKKISYIVLLVLFIVVAIDVIYWKILYLQIPKSDISSFVRVDHNVPLAEWEDGVAILKSKEKNEEINKIWNVLDLAYLSRFSVRGKHPSETNLSWEEYPDECIKVYSWGQAYCWTWAWSESTLRRLFRNQLGEDFVRLDETLEWRTISLYTYLEERESEIRKEVLEIDRVLSMNYNANNWLKNDLLPQFFQGYARWSVVLIEYYSLKNDWDMVLKLVENDLKMVDITNNFWWLIWTLISNAIEEIIYTSINSSIQVLPEDVRLKIAKLIEENNKDYSKMVKYIMQWEIENWNVSIDAVSSGYIYDGWLIQIFYHFPFYSESDSKRLVYNFYNVYNDFLNGKEVWNAQDFYQKIFDGESNFRWSIYNIKWMEILSIVAPRLQWGLSSIKWTYVHKESLLKNLESWTYKARYSEPEWNKNDDYYRASYIIEK